MKLPELEGQDKIIGRPIRLNKIRLEVKPKKDYAQLMLFGDLHLGYPTCDLKKAEEYLEWAKKSGVYVLCMGDLLESGLSTSVGDSVYQQTLNPQEQMESVVELLTPLAKKGLIIGFHIGNHESRILKATSINVSKIMAKMLGVRYLGFSCWSLLRVGSQRYSLYSTHGSGGSRFRHTKLKKAMDLTQWIDADIIAYGHLHELSANVNIKQLVDGRNQVKEADCRVVLTGSYLRWDKSYGQAMDMPICRVGSPTLKLMAGKKNVSVQI